MMKKVLVHEGQMEKTGLRTAVHICRGHFKHYGPDNKLFGKVEGTFWTPMHIRGDPSRGMVLKDYNVKTEPR